MELVVWLEMDADDLMLVGELCILILIFDGARPPRSNISSPPQSNISSPT